MAEKINLAILVEKRAALRKEVTRQVDALGAQKIIGCSTPLSARRAIVTSNEPGLLVVGNSENVESCHNLIGFCRSRAANWTIIALDHINSDESAPEAFSAGADDVLHVPFSHNEFLARLKLRLEQASGMERENELVDHNIFDSASLTNTEQEIMNFLVAHKGKTVTRNELARHMGDAGWVYGDRKYDVHITNIRKKLKNSTVPMYTVKSVRSVGYYVESADDIIR